MEVAHAFNSCRQTRVAGVRRRLPASKISLSFAIYQLNSIHFRVTWVYSALNGTNKFANTTKCARAKFRNRCGKCIWRWKIFYISIVLYGFGIGGVLCDFGWNGGAAIWAPHMPQIYIYGCVRVGLLTYTSVLVSKHLCGWRGHFECPSSILSRCFFTFSAANSLFVSV